MKKYTAFISAIVVLCSLLACSNATNTSNSSQTSTSVASSSTVSPVLSSEVLSFMSSSVIKASSIVSKSSSTSFTVSKVASSKTSSIAVSSSSLSSSSVFSEASSFTFNPETSSVITSSVAPIYAKELVITYPKTTLWLHETVTVTVNTIPEYVTSPATWTYTEAPYTHILSFYGRTNNSFTFKADKIGTATINVTLHITDLTDPINHFKTVEYAQVIMVIPNPILN